MTDSTDDEHSYLYVGDVNGIISCLRKQSVDGRASDMSDLSTTVSRTCANSLRVSTRMSSTKTRHTFCHSCIVQALQSSSLCPIDRQPLSLEDVKPAPKIVASLVNELVVSCPRQCGANVERACLRGHLNGTCDLEPIICACGETIIRRDQKSVLDFEQQEASDLSGCLHEWQFCDDCSTRVQRLDRKVSSLSNLKINNSPTFYLVHPNNPLVNTALCASQIRYSNPTMRYVPRTQFPVRMSRSVVHPQFSPASGSPHI